MPCAIKYEKGSDVVLQVWTGRVPKTEWSSRVIKHLCAPDYPRAGRVMVDTTGASWDADLTEADIESLLADSGQCLEKTFGSRVAIIVSDGWDTARLLERTVERLDPSTTVIAFNRLSTACKWLGLDIATTAGWIAQQKWGPAAGGGQGTGT